MKIYVAAFISLIAGFGGGFLTGKKVFETKYSKLANEEIDSVKAAYNRRMEAALKSAVNGRFGVPKNPVEGVKEKPADTISGPSQRVLTRSSLDDNPYEQAKKNYPIGGKVLKYDHARQGAKEVEDDEESEEVNSKGEEDREEPQTPDPNPEPYLISDEEFNSEEDIYDKVSLYYYRVNGILTEDDDEVINDAEIENTVGHEALETLDTQTTVWVRNERLKLDYEIVGVNGDYDLESHNATKNLSPREQYLEEQKRRGKVEE